MFSNYELMAITKTHAHTRHVVDGIYSLDLIPNYASKFPSFWICNSESRGQKGAHWFALFFESANKPAEFFCSLGKKPEEYEQRLVKILISNGNGAYKYNPNKYQADWSQSCGHYALYYVDWRARAESYEACMSKLSVKDAGRNERLVVTYVTKHMTPL